MELDVHIVRQSNSAWGFTLVGGNDSEIPLTVIKVLPNSPADRAGLENGDTILRIDGTQATDMTHAVASKAVSAAEDTLALGVVRGLYDPVLDDYEPLYEPIDQEDLDRLSEPTEVPFKVAEFIDVPSPLDSRSLTASPFVQPTKPYRPFSTEPLDVPPLEDPIILNPNYKDNFPQHEVEDILQIKPDIPPERKFKLPVSQQYDPEGKNIRKSLQEHSYEKTVEFREDKESREERKESTLTQKEMREKSMKQDVEYMQKMKQEIDLEKIERTASEIVEESIQKATSVAREIKTEIDVGILSEEQVKKCEVNEIKTEVKVTSESRQEIQETKIDVKEDTKAVSDLVELLDKTTDEIIKQTETKDVKKEVQKIESTSHQADLIEEKKLSTKQEIEETIEAGTVRRKTALFASDVEEKKDIEKKSGEKLKKDKRESQSEVQYQKETKSETGKRTNDTKLSTSKLLAEQRAYTIGLQTIPNIRGSTHSSYHYNLLLKTFFIHLTDVMVALSRFILTEPVFSEDKEAVVQEKVTVSETVKKGKAKDMSEYRDVEQKEVMKKEEIVYEKKVEDKMDVEMKGSKTEKKVTNDQKAINKVLKMEENINRMEEKQIVQDKTINTLNIGSVETKEQKIDRSEKKIVAGAKDEIFQKVRKEWREEKELMNEEYDEEYDEEYCEDEEFVETRRKTGAEMAQMAERKSAELMEKLDAVITEFQTKAGIEETDKSITTQRRTRSRSRSKAQERAMRVSEPLDMSSQIERKSYEATEMQTMSQSYEAKKMQKHLETRELKTPVPQTQDGKIMYVAIVESHVYTNPEAIIEEIATECTETSTTTKSMETSKIDRIETESSIRKEEIAETVIQKAQEIEQKSVEVIQPIQVVEDIKSVQTRQATTMIEMSATNIAQSSEVAIEEVKDEVLKIKEPPAQTLEVIYEATAKSVAESTEAYVEEVRTEALEIAQPKALQAKEIVETVVKTVAEASEVSIEEVKHEEFEVEEAIVTQASETVVENKATAIAEATTVPVKLGKTYDEASAELKIVKFVPAEVEEPIVVISEVELALHKRDVADSKIYESIVGVQTAVQENRESLDISQVASFKSVGETKLDKTINIEEVEEVPIQVIEKTEVAIEGLNETDTEMYQAALVKQSVDQSYEAKAITLDTKIDTTSIKETHIEQASSIEAKSTVEASFEASFEAKSISEASFEATSVSTQKHIEKSSQQTSTQQLSQQQIQKEETAETIRYVKEKEELSHQPVTDSTDSTSPPTPATPVTDEYMFQLEIPLPKNRGTTPVPRDCTPPDDEDPHIVKKRLVPQIDTTIESYTYEPPLPTPPAGRKLGSPEYKKPGLQGGSNRLKNMRYIKPGLRGGSDRPEFTKEEIMEIERKSSLLASAIDKTLKSIEEYKEEVGIEAKKEISVSSKTVTSSKVEHKTVSTKIQSNGTTTKEKTKEIKDSYDKEWKEIEKQVQSNDKDINELSINVTIEEANGESHNGKANDDRVQIIEVEVSARHNGNSHNGSDKIEKTEDNAMNNLSQNNNKTTTESESFIEKAMETVEITNENSQKHENVREISVPSQNSVASKVVRIEEPKEDPMQLYKPVKFDPEEIAKRKQMAGVPVIQEPITHGNKPEVYMTETGEIIGTHQGIVDGLEEAVVDLEVAKALGKPGMPDEKIAELISGEAEMLREAHVMGLSRVLSAHMHRADDDSSVDFQKIKPVIESLKDSEVLKALNEEVLRVKEQKKKEEKKWTTFLQKPKRPVPRPKFGYYRNVQEEEPEEVPYKVKIVKQPKPKVAPDYKPEDFDTGPLPWEQPQPEVLNGAPPVEPEEPILIPEESPEFLEAVDPLPESEVPDLEDTGIPLPPPPPEPVQIPSPLPEHTEEIREEVPEELNIETIVEETEPVVEEMEGERLAQQLLQSVQKMVDPNATLEQQLAQMRAQIAALAQLPCVIQQTLDLVTRQITQLSHQEPQKYQSNEEKQYQPKENQENEYSEDVVLPLPAARKLSSFHIMLNEDQQESGQDPQPTITEPDDEQQNVRTEHNEVREESVPMLSEEELARRRMQEEEMMAEQQKIEKQRKDVIDQMKLEHESRQVKQRPTPRVGKPKPMFGSPTPVNRPLVLPGGRKWRRPQDVYNEQMIAEVLNAQSEIIQGKVMGASFESVLLPYDERINFMKYEKPPVSLDHLQRSEVYKVVHNLDETPLKRVETRTPVIAEADYRERCRSISPYPTEKHVSIPQQLQP